MSHTSREPRLRTEPTVQRTPRLAPDEERDLVHRAAMGSRPARDELLRAHMPLVWSTAQRYARPGVPFEDLVGEGVIALMETVYRYEPSKGSRFGVYAGWWVRAYMRRYVLANQYLGPVPSTRNGRRILGALRRARRQLEQHLGREPSREELASALEVAPRELADVESTLLRPVSIGGDEDGMGFDPSGDVPSPEDVAAEREYQDANASRIQEALSHLSAREREVVRRRMIDEEPTSLSALGRSMGVSRERVRQIQQRAETKLRTRLGRWVA